MEILAQEAAIRLGDRIWREIRFKVFVKLPLLMESVNRFCSRANNDVGFAT